MSAKTLTQKWAAAWRGQAKSGANILALMAETGEHVAQTRDWTGLAAALDGADAERGKIANIIWAMFGDNLTARKDPKTGQTRFKMDWDADKPFDIKGRNQSGVIYDAIEKGLSFRSKELQDNIRKMRGGGEKPPKEVDVLAKSTFDSMKKKSKDNGVPLSAIMAHVARLAKEQVEAERLAEAI